MKAHLAFDIGCIECGEESTVVGVYLSHQEAAAAVDSYLDPDHHWGHEGWHGQHAVEVFDIELPEAAK